MKQAQLNIVAKQMCQGLVGLDVYTYMSVGPLLYSGMLKEKHLQLTGRSRLDMFNLDT